MPGRPHWLSTCWRRGQSDRAAKWAGRPLSRNDFLLRPLQLHLALVNKSALIMKIKRHDCYYCVLLFSDSHFEPLNAARSVTSPLSDSPVCFLLQVPSDDITSGCSRGEFISLFYFKLGFYCEGLSLTGGLKV